jgi:tRNA-splicing ligase RtcB
MKEKLQKLNEFEWLLPKGSREKMRVAAKIVANQAILRAIEDDAVQQLTNVATLPGVVEPVVGLPDMHWGYGLPMGAVSAFDENEGVISAGLCGFDINCGINLISTNLTVGEVEERKRELINLLYQNVPVGVGSKGKIRLSPSELDEVLVKGVGWAVEKGYFTKEDQEHVEEKGRMDGADPDKVSLLAKKRGGPQLGTLGSGNHFLEIQRVTDVFDKEKTKEWGINGKGQVMVMLHCGSRGLGHQVATDYLKIQEEAVRKYNIWLPDRQLACAPATSKEGQDFFAAMKCAVNYSFANKAVMTLWIRETFEKVFGRSWKDMEMKTLYSIAHNIVKLEEHLIGGERRKVYVHRKGATRAFPNIPVILAGSMGTASYLCIGSEAAMEKTFGSSAHGAGRAMSRNAAIRKFPGRVVEQDLLRKGIVSRAPTPQSLAEEAPEAYKDVEEVINSVHGSGISPKIARFEPLGVIKG